MEDRPPILLQARKMGTSKIIDGKKVITSKGMWKTRILRPDEYEDIYNRSNAQYKIISSCLLMTGMRYEELKRLRKHPEWIDKDGTIYLPPEAQKKEKRVQPQRFIKMSYAGREAIKRLFDLDAELPRNVVVDNYIKYNFKDYEGFSLKSFRKTWESWLVFYYHLPLEVALSQGHSATTQLQHYLGLPFSDEDKLKMKPYVEGWR
jgi:integrase